MITKAALLKADSMTDQELQTLHDLRPKFLAQCKLLASYGIPETIGIPDTDLLNILENIYARFAFRTHGYTTSHIPVILKHNMQSYPGS